MICPCFSDFLMSSCLFHFLLSDSCSHSVDCGPLSAMESMSDDELQFKNLGTEESVKKHAENKFNKFDWLACFVTDYEHFLEKDWKEKLNNAIKDEFITRMIEKWECEKLQS